MADAAGEQSLDYTGWRVVAAMFLVQVAMFGFGLYGLGIYLTELRRLNGWPTGLISTAATVSLVLGSLFAIFISDLMRWLGPRRLVLSGVAALAGSLVLLASADSVVQLFAGFAVLSLAWVGLGMVSAAAIVCAWFDRKRGLAISLTFTGASCSGIVLVPAMVVLVERVGYRSALWIAAAVIVIVLTPIVLAVVRIPRGDERAADSTAATSAPISRAALFADIGFWTLTAPFALALFVQVGFIIHQIAILTPLIGFQLAGAVVSETAPPRAALATNTLRSTCSRRSPSGWNTERCTLPSPAWPQPSTIEPVSCAITDTCARNSGICARGTTVCFSCQAGV